MTKPFDPSKPVQTRDGRKARIICTDREYKNLGQREENWPIIALILDSKGKEQPISYRVDGTAPYMGDDWTLINLPDIRKQYRKVTRVGTQGVSVRYSLEAAQADLRVSDGDQWVGLSETVYTDNVITQINFIPRDRP